MGAVQQTVFDIQEILKKVLNGGDTYSWVKNSIDRYAKYMDTHGKEVTGYPTGLTGLDDIIGGLMPDDFMLITARMGEGKSLVG